jgi:L-threonylcarbamoyladenylate synthase
VEPSSRDLSQAAQTLREGGLIALPTETVYGLGADASNELAVRRIFAAKGRPSTHPLIVHVAHLEAARRWAQAFPPAAEALAKAFWPGPLTLILRRSPRASDAVTGGQDTVGLRVPAHPVALKLLEAFDGGVAAPSANRFGRVSPTTAQHVREELGDQVDFVLDGGPCSVGVESTIIDLSQGQPRLLRPGGLALERVEAVLGQPVPTQTKATDVRAPGLLESHYAPRAGLSLLPTTALVSEAQRLVAEGLKVAVLGPPGLSLPAGAGLFEVPADDAGYARVLYATLREADAQGYGVILAAPPEAAGLGLAVGDRLRRAAHRP